MSNKNQLRASSQEMNVHCSDEIEKYRDPRALLEAIKETVRQVKNHLDQYPHFKVDQQVIQCHHFLTHFTNEIEKLVPLMDELDFEDVPVNGLRSTLRLWIRYLDGVTEETREVKLRKLILALIRHLTKALPVLIDACLFIKQDECDEMRHRKLTKRALDSFNMDDFQLLMCRKIMGKTFEFSVMVHCALFMRLAVWAMEKSWWRRIFCNHYIFQHHCNRSFLKKLTSAGPEECASWVRAADWKITRIASSICAWIRNPSRLKSKLYKKKFEIACPTLFAIEVDTEAVYLRSIETQRRVKVQSDSKNNYDTMNNNSTDDEKITPNQDDAKSTRSSKVQFYTLRSEKRGGDSSSGKTSSFQKERQSNESEPDGAKVKQLVKGGKGRCAFYSQKKTQASEPKSSRENEGKIVIYIHGGAFFGPKCSYFVDSILRDWSNKLPGVTFIVPDYSYCPEKTFPAAWQEMLDLYTWLVTSSEAEKTLGIAIDPSKIVLVGDSSGGLLSCSIMVMLNEINNHFQQQIAIPRQVVLFYPKTNTRLQTCPSTVLSGYELLVSGFLLIQVARAVLPIVRIDRQTNQSHLISLDERKTLPSTWYHDADYQMIDSPILSPVTYDRWVDLARVNLGIVALSFDPLLDDGIQLAKKWSGKVNLHIADNVCHAVNYFKLTALSAWSFDERAFEVVTSAVNSL